MISAIRSRRPNSATTGSAPSRFSSTRTTAICARARPRPRPVLTSRPCQTSTSNRKARFPAGTQAAGDPSHHQAATCIQPHVRRTGLEVRASQMRSAMTG